MPSSFAGLSRSQLDPATWATITIFELAEFGENSSLPEQPLHARSNLLYLNLRMQNC